MKKLVAVAVALLFLVTPVRMAQAHENPVIEHDICHALLFPLEVVAFVVTLPLVLVGGKPYSHDCKNNCYYKCH